MTTSRQVLIIGLDGATFTVIDPLLNEGALPGLARLIGSGVRAELLSTIPSATIPAWPSFMTGKNPGKHGVFDFFSRIPGGKIRLTRSEDIRTRTLWQILSDHGLRSIVLNIPNTYPPQPIDGIVISGMLTPPGAPFQPWRSHRPERTGPGRSRPPGRW